MKNIRPWTKPTAPRVGNTMRPVTRSGKEKAQEAAKSHVRVGIFHRTERTVSRNCARKKRRPAGAGPFSSSSSRCKTNDDRRTTKAYPILRVGTSRIHLRLSSLVLRLPRTSTITITITSTRRRKLFRNGNKVTVATTARQDRQDDFFGLGILSSCRRSPCLRGKIWELEV